MWIHFLAAVELSDRATVSDGTQEGACATATFPVCCRGSTVEPRLILLILLILLLFILFLLLRRVFAILCIILSRRLL